MKKFSERGQGLVELTIIAIIAGVLVYAVLLANQRNIAEGAETIGNAVGETIGDAAYEQETRNLDWQIANGTFVSAWVNNQRIPPSPQAIEHHDDIAGAEEAIRCYNDHGAFFIQANKRGDWYIHCLEEDGKTVRTTFWQQVGKQFHLRTAYTKGDGAWTWSQIRTFFETKWGATKATFPPDGVLYVDGVPAPYAP